MDWQKMLISTDQLMGLKGLILSQVSLGAHTQSARQKHEFSALLDLLLSRLHGQINPDGGHKSRQPELHLTVMKLILECRMAASIATISEWPAIDDMLQKMASIAKMWRGGSGQFAHFHFGGQSNSADIEQILERCQPGRRIPQHAPDTGFTRLSAARTTLIIDTGITGDNITDKKSPWQANAPASLFAFELSTNNSPLLVNSGQTSADTRLNKALSQTVAHTALSLDGIDNVHRNSHIIHLDIGQAEGGVLMDGTHDSYLKSHGMLHRRRLFLSRGGNNLRGHDRLNYTGMPAQIPAEAIIRFHLHPRVSAARLKTNQILLKISGHRTGWLFKASGAKIFLDQSLYMEIMQRRSCQQIVLRCPADDIQTKGEINIRWAFTRHWT